MKTQASSDRDSERAQFLQHVLDGLGQRPRRLSPMWFYDTRGSELFEQITELPEYYLTRVETGLLEQLADAVPELEPWRLAEVLIEYGSGSSRKTDLLLRCLPRLRSYVPIDVADEFLRDAAAALAARHPRLQVQPLVGDFSQLQRLPVSAEVRNRLGFFPGSTIGNLSPQQAHHFLRLRREELGDKGRLIVGVDLKKDVDVLLPAYDDAAGVTAAFNLNLLQRMNRELGADFVLAQWAHLACWNDDHGRVEMHLRSTQAQRVQIAGRCFDFAEGETIHTENSHKYQLSEFRLLARAAGWEPRRCWTDDQQRFALFLLS
ncbi:MAG: L-histidine N(alpha)-methyltransferase [Lysobacterales bacterium]